MPLPLSHSFGLIVTVVGLHSEEPGDAVLMTWFDPTGWLELVQEHKVHNSPMVPSMLQILLAMPLENYDLSSLQLHRFRGFPPVHRRRPRVREARPVRHDPPGLRSDRDLGEHDGQSRPMTRRLGSVGRIESRFRSDASSTTTATRLPVGERARSSARPRR